MDLKNAEQEAKDKEDEAKRKNLLLLRSENKKSTRLTFKHPFLSA